MQRIAGLINIPEEVSRHQLLHEFNTLFLKFDKVSEFYRYEPNDTCVFCYVSFDNQESFINFSSIYKPAASKNDIVYFYYDRPGNIESK
ncbi:hypothetical protein EBZ38_11120 [bacterium]|nr:hypothetical protein [bacterium]